MRRACGVGRRWSSRKVLFLTLLGTLMATIMVPAVALAWLSWDDIDPIVALEGGHSVAVRIEWPSNFTCGIKESIPVMVSVPKGMDARVVSESTESFGCVVLSTVTKVAERPGDKHDNQVGIAVKVKSQADFPVKVYVTLDNNWPRVFEGTSNRPVVGAVTVGD